MHRNHLRVSGRDNNLIRVLQSVPTLGSLRSIIGSAILVVELPRAWEL